MADQPDQPPDFVRSRLPWVVAVVALAVYLATLSKWVTLASLPTVATVTGWNWWQPTLVKPLFHAVTTPVRWLPIEAQPLALNFLSALFASITLALLVRSAAILPQDRTREQRSRLHSGDATLDSALRWVPPLLAAGVLGLQLTFWEHATAATGEMLNLLVFAAIVRCLLEFRLSRDDAWLVKLSALYGLGAADNHALVGFFPFALGAIAMMKGRAFASRSFLLPMLAVGVAGLLLYLMPPWMVVSDPDTAGTYFEWLRIELGTQKANLLGFPRSRALLLALVTVVPALLMAVRWPSSFGDTSAVGTVLTNLLLRALHAAFLVIGGWVAFDPVFGVRALGMGVPFLTFSYLGALAVAYYAGFFLLLARGGEEKSWRTESLPLRGLNHLMAATACVAVIGAPLALAQKNLAAVRAQNGPMLQQFADFGRSMLPERAALLSEKPQWLLLQAAAADPLKPAPLLVDTRWLPSVALHRKLARRHPDRWPKLPPELPSTNLLNAVQVTQVLLAAARSNAPVYLHPVWGAPFFETHHPVSRGVVHTLQRYEPGVMSPPPMAPSMVGANQGLWLAAFANFRAVETAQRWKAPDAPFVAGMYSQALNTWGVELQRLGRLEEAQRAFTACVQLTTNPAARLNLDVNAALRAGRPAGTNFTVRAGEVVRDSGTWWSLYNTHGPLDEPYFLLQLGRALQDTAFHRQALEQLHRAQALEPGSFAIAYTIAESLIQAHRTDAAEAQVRALRTTPAFQTEAQANEAALLRIDALAQLQRTNFATAALLLAKARALQPRNVAVLETLSQVQMISGRNAESAATLEAQLALVPDDVRALANLGGVFGRMGQHERAVAVLDRALKLQPAHVNSLINRGMANFSIGRLDDADRDYAALVKAEPLLPAGHFGLAEIALKRNQADAARRHFERGLRLAAPGAPDAQRAAEQLKKLPPGR
jgi:tetratricopeptide (TPR) repeat protein